MWLVYDLNKLTAHKDVMYVQHFLFRFFFVGTKIAHVLYAWVEKARCQMQKDSSVFSCVYRNKLQIHLSFMAQ